MYCSRSEFVIYQTTDFKNCFFFFSILDQSVAWNIVLLWSVIEFLPRLWTNFRPEHLLQSFISEIVFSITTILNSRNFILFYMNESHGNTIKPCDRTQILVFKLIRKWNWLLSKRWNCAFDENFVQIVDAQPLKYWRVTIS